MSYVFPRGLYTDVRIEHVYSTNVEYTFRELDECKEKKYSAAFIRVFDGAVWYYASTTDLSTIQREIDALASLASANDQLESSEIYKRFSANKDECMKFTGREVSNTPLDDKLALLGTIMPHVENGEYIKLWQIYYVDEYTVKEFYSSKGAELKFDYQRAGFGVSFRMADGDRLLRESYQKSAVYFDELTGFEAGLGELLAECREFLVSSVAIEPGEYTAVLAPMVTGVFTHECFGHKSESDFMIGDEETRKEWSLGKRVGFDELTIVDSGEIPGRGYVPYDDEGNRATTSYLVKNGLLTGRLHSAASAADLGEDVTGNGRAMSFEFEPIVRMTTTYIDKGTQTLDELIAGTEKGVFVKSLMHGSGMSTFTIAPTRAWYIRDGKLAEPVRISVMTGSVFEALGNIDGVSDKLELAQSVSGGCGKMDQAPLSVGFGGPYIRVRNMNVQ